MDQDLQAFIAHLEHNAAILLGSPHISANENRRAAETVFHEFRRRRNPFTLCRQIIAKSTNAFVQHQAASCLHGAVIRDWSLLTQEARHELLSYLITTVNSSNARSNQSGASPGGGDPPGPMANYVREELLLVAAVLLKRLACEEDESILESVLGSLCTALADTTCDLHHRLVAVSFLIAVLREYASSTRASDFGLPLKKHMRAKASFERTFLKRIFQSTLTSLKSCLEIITSAPSNQPLIACADTELKFLSKIMEALESILFWNFNILNIHSANYARSMDTVESPVLQPPIDWKEIFLDAGFMPFIARVFITLWTHPRLVKQVDEQTLHRTLQCVQQCASLSGSIVANPTIRLQYTVYLMQAVSESVMQLSNVYVSANHVTLLGKEWACLAQVINRIVMNVQCRDLVFKLDFAQLHSFLQVMAVLTVNMITSATSAQVCDRRSLVLGLFSDELLDQIDQVKSAIDIMLDSWQALVVTIETQDANQSDWSSSTIDHDETDASPMSDDQSSSRKGPLVQRLKLTHFTNQIFLTYLRSHLCAPDGLRPASIVMLEDEDEINEEFESDDRVTFDDQLNSIGTLGRLDVEDSVRILTEAFLSRLAQYGQLISVCCQTGQRVDGDQSEARASWMNINEDLHWLLLITINLITQTSYDTRFQIPREVMNLSIKKTNSTGGAENCDAVLQCDPTRATDPVVKLVTCCLQLCSMERALLESGRTDLLSPQTSFSATTFMSRWAQGYLMPDETQFTAISLVLNSCWGRDSPTASQVLDRSLLALVATRLTHWSSEQTLSHESSQMLVNFVLWSPVRSASVAACPTFSVFVGQDFASLPLATRKSLCHFIVTVGSSMDLKPSDEANGPLDEVNGNKEEVSTLTIERLDKILSGFIVSFDRVHQGLTNPEVVHTEKFRDHLIGMYECIQGMALAITPHNIPTVWKRYIKPVFLKFPYHLSHSSIRNSSNVVLTLLETVRELADRVLVYLSQTEQIPFYATCMDLLVSYSASRPNLHFDPSAQEEEAYNDILVIVELLQEIAQKEYIDWATTEEKSKDGTNQTIVSPVEVVFRGLSMLRPLMSEELLKFPRLCEAYYKLINFVCEDPDYTHITNSDYGLLGMVVLSCQLALRSAFQSEVKCHSLEIISLLANHYSRSPSEYTTLGQALDPLLADMWRFVLTDSIHSTSDVNLRDQVAGALFGLLSLHSPDSSAPESDPAKSAAASQQMVQVKCDKIICELLPSILNGGGTGSGPAGGALASRFGLGSALTLNQQVTPQLLEAVLNATHALLSTTDLTCSRINKTTFKQHFETYLIELQGLICIK